MTVDPDQRRTTSEWVLLTVGNRGPELARAVASIRQSDETANVTVLFNGADARLAPDHVDVVMTDSNIGIPAARDLVTRRSDAEVVVFLDDDAEAANGVIDHVLDAFDTDPALGAVALRLVDENGFTARRHVPRIGAREPERGGEVALFLGGACAIRRMAYEDAGGYWGELFYGHEELEFCWRLIDRGWHIRYLPEATVFHPRTEIGRHTEGWRMTGRNRVMIARRTLPWPVALAHVTAWLLVALLRAPGPTHRSAYLRGWRSGWRESVVRRPIRWRTVWDLVRIGRPPIV